MALLNDLLDSGRTVAPARGPRVAAEATDGVPASQSLNLNMEPQQQDNWCWAAVSVSVRKFYLAADPQTQCQLVNDEKRQTTCCADGASPQCNQTHVLDAPMRRVDVLLTMSLQRLAFAAVQQEIVKRRPIACRIGWNGGGGHFVCIDGYAQTAELGDVVSIKDSLFGASTVPYSVFVNGYMGTGRWTHSYTTRPPAQPVANHRPRPVGRPGVG